MILHNRSKRIIQYFGPETSEGQPRQTLNLPPGESRDIERKEAERLKRIFDESELQSVEDVRRTFGIADGVDESKLDTTKGVTVIPATNAENEALKNGTPLANTINAGDSAPKLSDKELMSPNYDAQAPTNLAGSGAGANANVAGGYGDAGDSAPASTSATTAKAPAGPATAKATTTAKASK